MSSLYISQFDIGPEHSELHWLAGLVCKQDAWFIRAVLREVIDGNFHMRLLPMGMLPILTLGQAYAAGKLMTLSAKGIMGSALIPDVSNYQEITSAEIPKALYSFNGKQGGVQRLFKYQAGDVEILIPTIELIRYLFLHNRTLANSLMRPSGIMSLFSPEMPGHYAELTLNFTAEMPKSSLSPQFAQEFAWLAVDPDARKSWDSVYIQSKDQDYLTFTPPPLKNSNWRFRGIQLGHQWLVLELLHLSGKVLPCDKLYYGHPSLKQAAPNVKSTESGSGTDGDPDENSTDAPQEKVIYNYRFDDGQDGSKASQQQKSVNNTFKQSSFDQIIPVEKVLIKQDKQASEANKRKSTREYKEKHETVWVSAGEQSSQGALPPIEFKLLIPASWEYLGDLDALEKVIKLLAKRLTDTKFAMSLCQLKGGRVFSMANRMPRLALVVSIYTLTMPPIVLLDVERTGEIALSLMALHFKESLPFEQFESSIKETLDGLIDSSGHWDVEIEEKLKSKCICERLPKMLTPRKSINNEGQLEVWAVKLRHKLNLPWPE